MALVERWASLDLATTGRIVLVLDASQSAHDHQQTILTLARQVLERLPARQPRSLYFLGSGQAYDPTRLASQSALFLRENKGRTSLITPVLRAVELSATTRLAVIGAGEIFDLDDWSEHAHFRNVLLVSVGEPMQPPGVVASTAMTRDADEVCRHLCRSVERVVIEGSGFLPLFWTNPEYTLDLSGPQPALSAEGADEYSVTVRYLCDESAEAEARIVSADDEIRSALSVAKAVDPSQNPLGVLDEAEQKVFGNAIARQTYRCPCCGQPHEWNIIRCPASGGILGTRVYRSVPHGFVGLAVFHENAGAVEVYEFGGSALPIAPGKVALLKGGRADVWQFDPAAGCWAKCPDRRLEPYFRLENGDYAVVL